jgi:hypothetical protein
LSVSASLIPGQTLRLLKAVAFAWSGTRSLPAVRDEADAAATGAMSTGWVGLLAEQRSYLDDFWEHCEIAGDVRLQQAARFAPFHVLQAGARAEDVAILSKGLTGPGYDGHLHRGMTIHPAIRFSAYYRAASTILRHIQGRKLRAMRIIMNGPLKNSAIVDCHPITKARIRPSSISRCTEVISNAI